MTFETLTLSLPAHWLPALINEDLTGLDDAEARSLTRWVRDTRREFGNFHFGDARDAGFVRYHDAAEYGVLACNCMDVDLMLAVSA